ncbi:MAG: DNA repair protein RadA [Patescibacteria group bacterium]
MPEAKIKNIFVCSHCDAQYPKWSGRCLECGSWGTLNEETEIVDSKAKGKKAQEEAYKKIIGAEIVDLSLISGGGPKRFLTGLGEIDRVLGGGLPEGSLTLLAGEPGIGKSTLAAQIANALKGKEVFYVSGEESASQVKARLVRLNCDLTHLKFLSETNIEKISAAALKLLPDLIIVDSIQTVYSAAMPSEAGSVSQIRAAAIKFLELAKERNIAVILIGHITKDGQVAGPKSLEHIVDTVLYLENEDAHQYSLLRSSKNRFGSVNELGVLEMTGSGFKEILDPSAIFLSGGEEFLSGSAVSCVIEGTRPFMVDIQALVTKTVFGYPQRKCSGLDLNRLQVLAAVISKRGALDLSSRDIILNVVGGLKISDPGLDLAVCAAIISSATNKNLSRTTVFLGELGLSGELRPVTRLEQRLKEAEKLGFKEAIIPDTEIKAGKIKLIKIKSLEQLKQYFS